MVLGILAAGAAAGLAAVYWRDTHQQKHTVLRNFPVIGHFRYFAETWGEYMRQYQYLPDWAERSHFFNISGMSYGALSHAVALRDEHGLTDVSGFRPRHVTEIERGVGGFRAHAG